MPTHYYLMLSFVLFLVGTAGVLLRRNALIVLMGIELQLNAGNLALISVPVTGDPNGPQAVAAVSQIRSQLAPRAFGHAGVQVLVGGAFRCSIIHFRRGRSSGLHPVFLLLHPALVAVERPHAVVPAGLLQVITDSSVPETWSASKAPNPADGSVEMMVSGCARLSYKMPSTI